MRIITVNVNGIRSAARKGFFRWLSYQRADVVCLQEILAQQAQLDEGAFRPRYWHCYYAGAVKKGYSGVADIIQAAACRRPYRAGYSRDRRRSALPGSGISGDQHRFPLCALRYFRSPEAAAENGLP